MQTLDTWYEKGKLYKDEKSQNTKRDLRRSVKSTQKDHGLEEARCIT